MAIIGNEVEKAKQALEQGDLVGIPTETVYGLAANAFNPEAVARIFDAKNRPSFDPLIVHVANKKAARELVLNMPADAIKLAKKFWPGPLTLLLPKKDIIPDLVTSGMANVAIRIPNHPLTLTLLSELRFPLVAPSANPFGYISPTTASHVNAQLGDVVKYILDGGPCTVGVESTIVGFPSEGPTIYRTGGISQEDIETEIGKVRVNKYSSSNPQAPGMLKSHYAPRTQVVLGEIETLLEKFKWKNVGILHFNASHKKSADKQCVSLALSTRGDLSEAAQNLFSHLRALDAMDLDIIIAETVPDTGIGKAINDRLRRAAAE